MSYYRGCPGDYDYVHFNDGCGVHNFNGVKMIVVEHIQVMSATNSISG